MRPQIYTFEFATRGNLLYSTSPLFIYVIKLVSLLLEIIDEAGRSKNPTTLAIEKLFASDELNSGEFAGKISRRPKTNRVSNLGGVPSDAFKDLLQKVFNTNVSVLRPNEGGNPSSQFNAFQFETDNGPATIILAGKGAVESERQERGLIDAIKNSNVTKIQFKNRTLSNVTGAAKIGRVAGYRHEPYADIELKVNNKPVRVSAKGFKAPSFGGGGLSGINEINIEDMNIFVENAYDKVFKEYSSVINSNPELKDQNLQGNPKFKDHYEVIPTNVLKDLLTGTEAIGGPVDYYYTGDMDVVSRVEGDTLIVDGSLLTIDEFIAKIGTLYLRIAKRNGPCYFTTEENVLTNITVPKLFTIKPGGVGGTQSRAFITIKR